MHYLKKKLSIFHDLEKGHKCKQAIKITQKVGKAQRQNCNCSLDK